MSKVEKLKVDCSNCGNKIIVLRNSRSCPKCGANFEADSIQKVFDDYETQLANSKSYQFAENLNKTSGGLRNIGQATSEFGCTLFLLPIGIFSLIFLLQMCAK